MSRRLAAAAVLLSLAAAAPTAATAQTTTGCVDPPPIEQQVATAPVVFLGTVTAVSDEGREAAVDVIRVWRGGPLPPKVDVRGTVATQSKVHTALDRTYAKGVAYLFVPTAGASPHFVENECSSTTTLTPELAALAPKGGGDLPSDVADSAAPTGADPTKLLPLAIGGVGFVFLGTMLLLARRRGRAPQSP